MDRLRGAAEALAAEAGIEPWYALGLVVEQRLAPDDRKDRGVHFTPPWLARAMAGLVVDEHCTPVVDLACGAGVFLLAALDRLVERGVAPASALARVRGVDVDADSVSATNAAVSWWCDAHGVSDGDHVATVGDPLVDEALVGDAIDGPTDAVGVVLGNPPFLDQLDARSARTPERRRALDDMFDLAAYTDDSALFLARAVEVAGPTGRVALVLPRSLLAARDAHPLRRHVAATTRLRAAWFDRPDTFTAGVRTWVVVTDGAHRGGVDLLDADFDVHDTVTPPGPESWAPLLTALDGVPDLTLASPATVGDLAEVVAGFRDEYYGLVDAVSDDHDAVHPRLVTSGVIDLADDRWGREPVRFAKRRWQRPRVDLDAVTSDRVRSWARRLLSPKVLVATQTRVVEAIVDEHGDAIGSVPVLNVVARDPLDVWRVAAAVAAPPVTAWALGRTAGTALSPGALKLSADDVRAVPLPTDESAWSIATEHFRAAQLAGDDAARERLLDSYARTITRAYGQDESVTTWWRSRQ